MMLTAVNLRYAIFVLANLLRMRGNGKQAKSGAQTYRCKCGFSCTEGERPKAPPTIGDEPMTQVERNRRYRAKKREQK